MNSYKGGVKLRLAGGKPWRALALTMALGAVVVSNIGCAKTGIQAGAASYADPYLIVQDRKLARQIRIASIEYDEVGNLPRGTAVIRSNNRKEQLSLQYRFSWYDVTGREIDSRGQPYQMLLIPPRDVVTVSSVAPHPRAEEFKIHVKRVQQPEMER